MPEIIDIQVILKHETPQAVLVEYDEDKPAVWLPKSQIEIERDEGEKTHTVTLPQWLAEEKGMV